MEAFVHGSLCVSLSGQCFMSYAIGGRSANRGACAQPCRKEYTLTDASGKVIIQNKHLLSLKDLDRSKSIRELAAAGIRSFKIEGRLKDIDYVKNITAYYREELDRILEEKPEFAPASYGKTTFFFTPDPAKTFHRGATEYFLRGRKERVAGLDSPKSTGEELGEVIKLNRDSFQLSGNKLIANNDGLTFAGRNGESAGLKVNRAENGTIYPDRMNGLFVGAQIFRNYDHAFQMTLGKKTAERKIPIGMALTETSNGFELRMATRTVVPVSFAVVMAKIPANDPVKSHENILRQLAKSGDTPFLVREVATGENEKYFFTAQQLNELRRGLLEKILNSDVEAIMNDLAENHTASNPITRKSVSSAPIPNSTPFPAEAIHFENNITNRLAVQFYRRHGIEQPEIGVEKRNLTGRLQVMTTKHCFQHELGFCKRFGGAFPDELALPFSLKDGVNIFELEFDCKICMMRVYKE